MRTHTIKPGTGFHRHPAGRLRRLFRGGARGQAMVEFALVVPMVLVLLFAIIDMGRAYSAWVTTTNAAREGARLGITGASGAAIISRTQATSGSYNDSHLTVTVSYPDSGGNISGNSVRVATSYSLSLITPLVGLVRLLPRGSTIPSRFTLTSSADMRIE